MNQPTTTGVARPASEIRQSWAMLRRVLHAADLEPSAKVVLLCVLDHAGYGRASCTASNATLAREAGLADRRTRLLLADLVADSWLFARRENGKHGRRTLHPGPRAGGGTPPPGGWHSSAGERALGRQGGRHPDAAGGGTPVPPNGIMNGPGNTPDVFASRFFGHLPEFSRAPTGPATGPTASTPLLPPSRVPGGPTGRPRP